MKPPYFQERTLLPRVNKYMEEHDHVDVEDMTDYLIKTCKEFRGKKKRAFMKSVEKAYEWQKYCRGEDDSDSSVADIYDSDGGGPDIIELDEPRSKTKNVNSVINKMYSSASAPPSPGTPKTSEKRNFYVIDTEGSLASTNGTKTPEQKSVSKKRKKNTENTIEDIIKKKKKKQFVAEEPAVTFAHMAGVEPLKDTVSDLLANLWYPGVLEPLQKSVLVSGPTGSGKTLFAQALAGTAGCALLRVTATELVGGVSGESEEKIGELFEQAISQVPCVLLLEKLDVIAPKEGSTKSLEKRIGAQLSSSLNKLHTKYKEKQVLVVGETSHPENMDWDLRNSFDTDMVMAIPTQSARASMVQLMCQETTFAGDFEEIAHRTPGYVAGDLRNLLKKSQSLAWKRKKDMLYGKSEEGNLMDQIKSFKTQLDKMMEAGEAKKGVNLTMEDFMEALLHVTPVLKREGFPTVPDITWEDIGGLQDIKKELREKILEPIKYPKLHTEFGASRPNGILMWGPPGCGKTMLAKAVANEAGINLLPVMGPELLNMYQGESERAVREVFRRAHNVAPCVIFFDEFDSLCPVRKGAESGSRTTIVNTLLIEMNGFTSRDQVYVIAATNRPDILDPAVTRPGRFDTLVYVDVPDHAGRVSIFQARTKTRPHLADDVNLEEVARQCTNFSGADCDQLVYLASKEAIREVIHTQEAHTEEPVKRYVAMRHFAAALSNIKPSIKPEELRRYKKLHLKMEAAKRRGDEAGFPEDASSVLLQTDHLPQPMDSCDSTPAEAT